MSPEKILTHSLFGPDAWVEDENEVKDALRDLLTDGWVLLKPEDCCRDKIQDLDAEVWTP